MSATVSIAFSPSPQGLYLLRIADTCLVLSQRLAEWCGHAPILEEDIALTNMSLDLIGQARALLTHVGRREAAGHGGVPLDEDQLAFLRDERDFRNLTMSELPNSLRPDRIGRDFALTVVRNLMLAAWLQGLWERLQASTDEEVAGIAGKAVKEARYHVRHAADWLARLADGTDESRRRVEAVWPYLWRFVPELFFADDADAAAEAGGLGPSRAALREGWDATMAAAMTPLGLAPPPAVGYVPTATLGRHTEHMGRLLAEMQVLQRTFPGGRW